MVVSRSLNSFLDRHREGVNSVRAIVAIFGSITFWVGAWEIATNGRLLLATGNDGDSSVQYGIEFLIGVVACVVASSLHANAGLEAPPLTKPWKTGFLLVVRWLIATPGTVVLWAGLYSLYGSQRLGLTNLSLGQDFGGFCFGIALLIFTQTFHSTAYIDDAPSCGDYSSKRNCFPLAIIEGIRALLSILGQTAIWYFSWNLLEVQVVRLQVLEVGDQTFPKNFHGIKRKSFIVVSEIGDEGRLFQHMCYIAIGLLALVASEAVISSSWIAVDEDSAPAIVPSPKISRRRRQDSHNSHASDDGDEYVGHVPDKREPVWENRIILWIRSILALSGQVVANTGAWVILDEYIAAEDTTARNVSFIFIGLFLLFLTGVDTPLSNMSLERWFPEEEEENSDSKEALLADTLTDV